MEFRCYLHKFLLIIFEKFIFSIDVSSKGIDTKVKSVKIKDRKLMPDFYNLSFKVFIY